MRCPNCGTPDAGPGFFCMACGVKLPSRNAAFGTPAAAPIIATGQAVNPAYAGPLKTLRRISVGSVFKVTFVIYALLLGLFGCLFMVLPGLFGASLLGGLGGRDSGLALFGGSFIGILISYILLVVFGAFLQGIVTVIAALIYNLAARWVGGIQVELQE